MLQKCYKMILKSQGGKGNFMKIENTELTNEHIGSKVTYIPSHAHGLANHEDCKGGTISSWNDSYIFVNYGTGTNQATYPRHLVWG